MHRIPISEAAAGMVLGEPAVDAQGRILVGKGEVLTDKLIERFHNYGVQELVVTGNDPDEAPSVLSEVPEIRSRQEALQRVMDDRFRHHKSSALMDKIRRLAEKNLFQQSLPSVP